jgi:hypothetical protein
VLKRGGVFWGAVLVSVVSIPGRFMSLVIEAVITAIKEYLHRSVQSIFLDLSE